VRLALRVLLALTVSAGSAGAQTLPSLQAPDPPRESTVAFLPRFDFRVSMEHLFSDETRYVWDANFGGDVDLVAIGRTRATFVANYQTILGSEFRAFDPNQGNYTLEGSVSTRARAIEVAGVFHHVSRHLSDRPKRFPVDWNMVGGRIRGGGRHDRIEYEARADLRGVIQHTFVDYRWELDTEALARVSLRPRVAVMATGAWRVIGVDGSRARGAQHGFRGEGGVRLAGGSATLDLFVAAEQRVDAYQLEFSTVRWLTAGFRISSLGPSRVP
jgi:hypothetical protein